MLRSFQNTENTKTQNKVYYVSKNALFQIKKIKYLRPIYKILMIFTITKLYIHSIHICI